jgi:hypothetical protein
MSTENMDMLVGASFRLIHSDYLEQASGFAGDIGGQMILHNGPFPYELGFVAQNIGDGQKFDSVRADLPLQFKLAGAIHPIDQATISCDLILPEYDVAYGAVGAEYAVKISNDFSGALRLGFNTLNIRSLGVFAGFSGGAGLTLGSFSFDYAFTPFGVLNSAISRFSISYHFRPSNHTSAKQAPWTL